MSLPWRYFRRPFLPHHIFSSSFPFPFSPQPLWLLLPPLFLVSAPSPPHVPPPSPETTQLASCLHQVCTRRVPTRVLSSHRLSHRCLFAFTYQLLEFFAELSLVSLGSRCPSPHATQRTSCCPTSEALMEGVFRSVLAVLSSGASCLCCHVTNTPSTARCAGVPVRYIRMPEAILDVGAQTCQCSITISFYDTSVLTGTRP